MTNYKGHLILLHGLWNNSKIFNPLIQKIENKGLKIHVPEFPHDYGRVDLFSLSRLLDEYISRNLGENKKINLLGFSMGGLIARIWLQKMNGASKTSRFISVGSPHKGTFLAQVVPNYLLAGIAQMKRKSSLIEELNYDFSSLNNVECISFFCPWDLMVVPGWQATLPLGVKTSIPVAFHRELITSPMAIEILVDSILTDIN